MKSYDVRIWGIRARNSKKAPYQLRWSVAGQVHQTPFATKTLADARRAQLLTATRDGEAFDVDSGLPMSEHRAAASPTWYDHACAYAAMKWPGAAAKHRVGIAEALTAVTMTLVTSNRGAPDKKVLRRALREWAFRAVRDDNVEKYVPRKDAEDVPADVAAALTWVSEHSVKVADMTDSARLRDVLTVLSRRLDGKVAADNTVRRKHSVLSNALRYAVEREILTANPLSRIDWKTPDTDDEVDFRYVPGPVLAHALLEAVRGAGERGPYLSAFFACMYYAAMRPSEVASLTRRACRLPEDGWGELILSRSRPEVGSGWTDDGKSYEERGLKRRARKATRPVPIPPVLVAILRRHLAEYGTGKDGRLFTAAMGGRIRSTEYADAWKNARKKALPAEDVGTPLAEVPYSLRHACVSLWIKAGVDPVEVARRAGHSPAVLWKFYAKILRGQQEVSNGLIDKALSAE
ncbi:tyrosine-type recombinase/integrase [Streptomyces sp. NPDC088817]|uniref:tyrosine-type recombinase/integrase n=1 Tax=Streptomyces sp. NPDC088817 TaxID=3365907 RepID=UPI003802A66C